MAAASLDGVEIRDVQRAERYRSSSAATTVSGCAPWHRGLERKIVRALALACVHHLLFSRSTTGISFTVQELELSR
jgi:hypothetical protein